ncbi:Uncharacterised protein [Vibrio cholerae]|uniref:Uncharacterized protein n=1 Tax=Vibrio cholerae TaxID=666 RepID=A0A655UHD4_VIBCL|nr:Uncharacterised protein [Vibrio cholerae]CSB50936.1 Uncharacterised protein [Vibrio cholerae]
MRIALLTRRHQVQRRIVALVFIARKFLLSNGRFVIGNRNVELFRRGIVIVIGRRHIHRKFDVVSISVIQLCNWSESGRSVRLNG